MRAQVILKFGGDLNRITTGIYLLKIGDMFYVGKSEHMVSRCVGHVRNINASFYNGYPTLISKSVFDYLINNPKITELHMSILERCKEQELYYKEQYWVDKYEKTGKLLNSQKKVCPSARDVARMEFRPGSFKIELEISTLKEYMEIKSMLKGLSLKPRKIKVSRI